MKQILTTLLLLFSLTISAQTTVVTGPKKKLQTTTVDNKKQQAEQQRKAAEAAAEAKRKEQLRKQHAEQAHREQLRKEQEEQARQEQWRQEQAQREEQARQEQLRREQAQREEQTRQVQLRREQAQREELARQERLRYGNGHDWVDLGLSVKWATCNIGADKPEGYGYLFTWGKTDTSSKIQRCSTKKYAKNKKTTLDLEDDAAHENWGGSWRMPTKSEQMELINNCTWTKTTVNGISGYLVISKYNGNSIFLPTAGTWYYSLHGQGEEGHYLSSSLDTDRSDFAYYLNFNMGNLFGLPNGSGGKEATVMREHKLSVRAVCP